MSEASFETQPGTVTLFAGSVRPLPPNNRPSGIFKTALNQPAWVGMNGLAGDEQADLRVHGGPEKALHQYPAGNYAALANTFPDVIDDLVPGSLGENLSVAGWDETNVCIGDIFQLGDAVIQVSQPRTPCWKIDSRFGVEGMTQFIHDHGLTGWYFRVLKEGLAGPGGEFRRIEKDSREMTVERLLTIWREHRPDPEMLESIAAMPTLSPNWVKKLKDRAQQLRRLP